MKTIKALLMVLCLALAVAPVSAQKTKKVKMKENGKTELSLQNEVPQRQLKTEVTEECTINLSLFTESAKVKNYADALEPWQSVYNDCPAASKNIYILGVRILEWKMKQATTQEEKDAVFNQLMQLYDDQILYFGNDNKSPRPDILGKKAASHYEYRPTDFATIYPWLKEAVETLQLQADPGVLQLFMIASNGLYKNDNSLAEQYINDYTLANGLLDQNSQNTNLKNAAVYGQVKDVVNTTFAVSGVADCAKMNEIFLPNVEKNKENSEYLTGIIRLFKRLKCTETQAYFTAAEYTHKIAPSSESATGLGNMCLSKKQYNEAITYYEEATRLSDNDEDIADNLFNIAFCYFQTKQPVKSREYCKQSLAKNPNQGRPHLILGLLYAQAGSISDDPVLNRAKYWAAVDQFIKAKNASADDAAIVEQCNTYISTYRSHFPSKEEIFMHPELNEGSSYYVGSWINESTTARSK